MKKFDGFKFGDANIQLDDTLLLIEPEAAKAYEAANPAVTPAPGTTRARVSGTNAADTIGDRASGTNGS